MRVLVSAIVAAAVSAVAPAVAQEQSQQQGGNGGPEVAQNCLQDLEKANRALLAANFGTARPGGYGTASGYGTTTSTGMGPRTTGALTTPRGQMRALMQAGYVTAINGDKETCQAILSGIERIYQRHQDAIESPATAPADLEAWRQEWMQAAVPVTEIEASLSTDMLLGLDVRNMQDEDLGDIDEIAFDRQGNARYALISRGGFLGMGEDLIPVPWEELRITPSPYRDTIVLDVSEETIANAPTVPDDDTQQLAEAAPERVDQYWQEHLGD
ncbi:PRC-barrel domain-containing protein [Caenispirillum salinarum]|uniref:PRC-barrel domain-containing protein n=1 Tax=Caenispirillum salinarum TaxID=859058 RepID=UPI0038505C09